MPDSSTSLETEYRAVRGVVTDIEGTTSSLSFVHDVLFPYAREQMEGFVRAEQMTPDVREQLDAVDGDSLDQKIQTLIDWIDRDEKATPLKALQGMIWKRGFEAGDFRGHIYPDAVAGLRRWSRQGLRLFVYSSGSTQAQRLLFGHSEAGDLTELFSGYFDTTTGPKREPASYASISHAVGIEAGNLLFLSDVEAELDAARASGLQTCWLIREGDMPAQPAHPVAASFDSIRIIAD